MSLADRWRLGWLALAAVFVAPVGYAGPLGFVPLVAIPALALLPTLRVRSWPWPALALVALLLWALVTWTWSLTPPRLDQIHRYADAEAQTGLKLVLQFAIYTAFVLAAGAASPRVSRVVMVTLALALAALTLGLLFESVTGAALYRAVQPHTRPDLAFKNAGKGAFVVATLFWPVAATFSRWRPRGAAYATALGLIAIAAAVMLGLSAPAVAMLAGGLALLVVRGSPRLGPWLCAAGAAAFVMAAPSLARLLPPGGAGEPESWAARNTIWRFVAERIGERPLQGWGLDASRAFGGPVPLHPHDAPLQIWAELGLPGALLFAAFWAVTFWMCARAAKADRTVGGIWAATATAYFVIGALSFGVWQDWWLALGAFAFAAALMLLNGWQDAGAKRGLAPLHAMS